MGRHCAQPGFCFWTESELWAKLNSSLDLVSYISWNISCTWDMALWADWDLTLAFFLPQNPFVKVESHRNQAFQRWHLHIAVSSLNS